jgi:hypothetical protein
VRGSDERIDSRTIFVVIVLPGEIVEGAIPLHEDLLLNVENLGHLFDAAGRVVVFAGSIHTHGEKAVPAPTENLFVKGLFEKPSAVFCNDGWDPIIMTPLGQELES